MSRLRPTPGSPPARQREVLIWDWPLRLSHWSMAGLFVLLLITAEQGRMLWHIRAGYLLSGLVLFRLLWGFAGSYHARFSSFIRSPRTTLAYMLQLLRRQPPATPGHNPLGALMVLLLLAGLAVQSLSGLVTSDEVMWQGPLYAMAPDWLADSGAWLHHQLQLVLKLAVVVHILAVLWHQLLLREPLIGAMLHGRKPAAPWPAAGSGPLTVKTRHGRALLLLALAGGWIGWLWTLPV